MAVKLKWKVAEAPTGPYRSFEKRRWPTAEYVDGSPAARIECDDRYVPANARSGNHAPLTLWIADHSAKPNWAWRKAKSTFATLQEAKDAVTDLLKKNPQCVPDQFKSDK